MRAVLFFIADLGCRVEVYQNWCDAQSGAARTSARCAPPARKAGAPRFRGQHRLRGSDDHAADDFARLHGAEGVVDLVQFDLLRHHLVDVEATGLDEIDEALEVAAHARRAVLTAE